MENIDCIQLKEKPDEPTSVIDDWLRTANDNYRSLAVVLCEYLAAVCVVLLPHSYPDDCRSTVWTD